MYSFKITNEKLFGEKVIDVETESLTGSDSGAFASGTLTIETKQEGRRDFTGDHDQFDYEDEFGFIIE